MNGDRIKPIRIDRGDVYVVPQEPFECETCDAYASRIVTIDLRSIGQTIHVGRYCAGCADEVAQNIRAALPVEQDP